MMKFEKFTLMVLISAVGAKISKDPFPLKVLSLNTWGMPDSIWSHMIHEFGSYDKKMRMKLANRPKRSDKEEEET